MLFLMMRRKRRTPNAQHSGQNVNGKRRRHSIVAFEMVQVDRAAAEPLHQQLYRQIHDELASGMLRRRGGIRRLRSINEAMSSDLPATRRLLKGTSYTRSCGPGRMASDS